MRISQLEPLWETGDSKYLLSLLADVGIFWVQIMLYDLSVYNYDDNGVFLYNLTKYFMQTPYCVTFEHDKREKDPETGLYKIDFDQVYNRTEQNEER